MEYLAGIDVGAVVPSLHVVALTVKLVYGRLGLLAQTNVGIKVIIRQWGEGNGPYVAVTERGIVSWPGGSYNCRLSSHCKVCL